MQRVDVDSFIRHGFVRVDGAFSSTLAATCRDILWSEVGCDPRDASTWTRPVVRLGMHSEPPFREAANSDVLRCAFDDLVGRDRWLPCGAVGTFPVRFPSTSDPGDVGWHVDASFGVDESPADFMAWRVNIASRGRALLVLLLFADVEADDAPTRIRVGSHAEIARQLAPAGDAGLSLGDLAADGFARSAHRAEALAVGPAGTAYLCHPFLVHSAQLHRGRAPRFMAQPPLLPRQPLFGTGAPLNAVERAIVDATRAAS
jgi:hypothetical protein